jgi:hypothetical protein
MRLVSAGKGDGQDIEASDAVKMSDFGRPDAPSGSDGSSRDEPVVRPDAQPCCCEFRPDAGVRTSGE